MLKVPKLGKSIGELFVWGLIAGVLIAGCGGGASSTSGFAQSYTSSAGAGDVLQFNVDTKNMTYSFTVIDTSYTASRVSAASSVSATESSHGTLTLKNIVGSYNLSASADNFILGGEVYALSNGLFVGHVEIAPIGGIRKIPVIGVPNPITDLTKLAGIYNYQGFGCSGLTGGNVQGTIPCSSRTGTISVTYPGNSTSNAAFITCKAGNLATSSPACTTQATGYIVPTATSGVYDYQAGGSHTGWFFAFTVGTQNVVIIDHDDSVTPYYGHSVALSQTSLSPGQIDGSYFVVNNIGMKNLFTITGTNYSDYNALTNITTNGTLSYNTPWTGLVTYSGNVASGVADIATAGAFTYTSNSISYLHGVGLKYK